jgi:hypothetical protein
MLAIAGGTEESHNNLSQYCVLAKISIWDLWNMMEKS